MNNAVELRNPETGASVVGEDAGSDRDIFLAKVSLDGVPEAVWAYPSTEREDLATSYPQDVHVTDDGAFVVMGGYFTDSIQFGDTTLVNTLGTSAGKNGFVAKIATARAALEPSTRASATASTRALRVRFETSTRAVDSSQIRPDRPRCDRAREFRSLAARPRLTV